MADNDGLLKIELHCQANITHTNIHQGGGGGFQGIADLIEDHHQHVASGWVDGWMGGAWTHHHLVSRKGVRERGKWGEEGERKG